MAEFIKIDESNFDTLVLKQNKPILLEFGGTWCKPCKTLEPLLKQLSDEVWQDKLEIAKLDVDDCPQLTMQFQVMSVPTTILFIDGKPVEQINGLQSRNRIHEKVWQHVT
ncbi:MAG: thioredoxin family protein [Anaerolineaceae bacterium]|nr:thioredoxin family protein [Anaerolineaceae bacterium]